MSLVFLGLGGNIGHTLTILQAAYKEIQKLSINHKLRCSPFYHTSPVACSPQPDYINAACTFKTSLKPQHLLRELQRIELQLGKLPKAKSAPRKIDIDILFYDQNIINIPELQIPHPRWSERLFVVRPLADLASTLSVPTQTGTSELIHLPTLIQQLAALHPDEKVAPLQPGTAI